MGNQADEQHTDEGLIKKPMKGSVKRVSDRMAEEMSEKSPSEAVRDDLGGSSEPSDEERERLEDRVEGARGRRGEGA